MLVNSAIVNEIKIIIAGAKVRADRAVGHKRVLMYWQIGEIIFEEEQQGKDRADYGTYLIKYLSEQLQPDSGSGFSRRRFEIFRQFFRMFPTAQTVSTQMTWSY